MKLKRTICMAIAMTILSTAVIPTMTAGAAEEPTNPYVRTVSHDVITDVEQMGDLAVQVPITDEAGNSTYRVTNEELGIDQERYEIEQIVEQEFNTVTGIVTQDYMATTVDFLVDTYALSDGTSTSTYKEQWDSTGGVKFYTNVYYTKYADSALPGTYFYDISRVGGGYSRSDTSLSVVSQVLEMNQTGINSHYIQSTYADSWSMGTGSSWTQYAPSNWLPCNPNRSYGYVYSRLHYSVKRSQSSWGGTLETVLVRP